MVQWLRALFDRNDALVRLLRVLQFLLFFISTFVLSFILIFTPSAMPVKPKQALALLLLIFSLTESPPQLNTSRKEKKLAAHLVEIIEQAESGENSTCGRQDKIYFRAFSA